MDAIDDVVEELNRKALEGMQIIINNGGSPQVNPALGFSSASLPAAAVAATPAVLQKNPAAVRVAAARASRQAAAPTAVPTAAPTAAPTVAPPLATLHQPQAAAAAGLIDDSEVARIHGLNAEGRYDELDNLTTQQLAYYFGKHEGNAANFEWKAEAAARRAAGMGVGPLPPPPVVPAVVTAAPPVVATAAPPVAPPPAAPTVIPGAAPIQKSSFFNWIFGRKRGARVTPTAQPTPQAPAPTALQRLGRERAAARAAHAALPEVERRKRQDEDAAIRAAYGRYKLAGEVYDDLPRNASIVERQAANMAADEARIQHERLVEEVRIQREARAAQAAKKRGLFGLWGGRKTVRKHRSSRARR